MNGVEVHLNQTTQHIIHDNQSNQSTEHYTTKAGKKVKPPVLLTASCLGHLKD